MNNGSLQKNDHPELKAQVAVNIMKLRRHNRLIQYRMKQSKDEAAKERQAVEERYLTLQNSLNEIHHLQKEIKRCTDFRSADEDFELDPVDDFYSRAPAHISMPEITMTNEHQRRLARLNWELYERKE